MGNVCALRALLIFPHRSVSQEQNWRGGCGHINTTSPKLATGIMAKFIHYVLGFEHKSTWDIMLPEEVPAVKAFCHLDWSPAYRTSRQTYSLSASVETLGGCMLIAQAGNCRSNLLELSCPAWERMCEHHRGCSCQVCTSWWCACVLEQWQSSLKL